MNRLLQLARQMHQRRVNHFYLVPDEQEENLTRQLALGTQGKTAPLPLYRDAVEEDYALDDDYGFDEQD